MFSQHWWKSCRADINCISDFAALSEESEINLSHKTKFWIKNLYLSQWECYVLKPVEFSLIYDLFLSLSTPVLWILNFLLVFTCWGIAISICNKEMWNSFDGGNLKDWFYTTGVKWNFLIKSNKCKSKAKVSSETHQPWRNTSERKPETCFLS